MEEFADLLDIALINLQEAGQNQELGDGYLYTKLQRKLHQSMLARYHRWVFETNTAESVVTLRKWILQESEFQTNASETVHGLTGKIGSDALTYSPFRRSKNQGAYFGEVKDSRSMSNSSCQVCGSQHRIWNCPEFCQKTVHERWDVAKRFQLCFRCLGDRHSGKSCQRSRPCGLNGCRELHHKLLHNQSTYRSASTEPKSGFLSSTEPKLVDETRDGHQDLDSTSPDLDTSVTEGNEQNHQTTMMTQNEYRPDFVALRTVPVVLRNGTRTLKVNTLLDDASTKTYLNADVAAELGLQGQTEKVTVNVLNDQVETLETKPVNFKLESLDGNVSMNVSA